MIWLGLGVLSLIAGVFVMSACILSGRISRQEEAEAARRHA